MMRRRRGQLVLLAAAVVVTALVPMLLAYAQLTAGVGAGGDVADTADERATLADTERVLERSVSDATRTLANTSADRHDILAVRVGDRLALTLAELESSGSNRGVAISIARNATVARRWARNACPRGPARVFDTCAVTDGIVTQTRANSTALVAVAFDVTVRGPDGTARATVVVRGVRGVVAADADGRRPSL